MKNSFDLETEGTSPSYDVIIVGGSYSGLSAAMALGRALRNVLVIDSAKPCNIQTPQSHNFLTQDGKSPLEISENAKAQVEQYKTIQFCNGLAVSTTVTQSGFEVAIDSGHHFKAKKIIFATGLRDIMPNIDGFSECWGISILHCPYCHGYEVRNEETGIFANGDNAFELARLISNWTDRLTIFTDGEAGLSENQLLKLKEKDIKIIEKVILKIEHTEGRVEKIQFDGGQSVSVKAIYARPDFEQQSQIPGALGCEMTEPGLIKVDAFQQTNVAGIYACGDNSSMRSVAVAVATGSLCGAIVKKDLISEEF